MDVHSPGCAASLVRRQRSSRYILSVRGVGVRSRSRGARSGGRVCAAGSSRSLFGTALLLMVLAAAPIVVLLHNKAYAEADQRLILQRPSRSRTISAPVSTTMRDRRSMFSGSNARDEPAVTVLLPDGRQSGASMSAGVPRAVLAVAGPHLPADHDSDTLGELSSPHTARGVGWPGHPGLQRIPQNGPARAVAGAGPMCSARVSLAAQYGVAVAIAVGLALLLAWAAAE